MTYFGDLVTLREDVLGIIDRALASAVADMNITSKDAERVIEDLTHVKTVIDATIFLAHRGDKRYINSELPDDIKKTIARIEHSKKILLALYGPREG